jgi:tetrahydromethanopterin S-methyltransferase subunit H
MYSFATEQKIFKIGHVRIGGQPGELPTAMIGTVFYGKKYKDMGRDEIEALVNRQLAFSDMTGNQAICDIFLGSDEHIEPRLSMIMDILPDNHAFAIDVPEAEVRIAALAHLAEIGALDRCIYNSINLGATENEMRALDEHTPNGAIVLAYNPRDLSTDGRIAILENGSEIVDKGLLTLARDCGIETTLLDTAATPFEHSAAETVRAIPALKNKLGLPVGCSIHNLVESWLWLKEYKKENKGIYPICDIGSNGLVILLGGNYTIYGPIHNAEKAFPFVAMVDKIVSEGAEEYFGVAPPDVHPRSKMP